MAKHKDRQSYLRLEKERQKSLTQVERFKELADIVISLSRGGSNNFEWSRGSQGWKEPTLTQMMESLGMMSVDVDGCAFDLVIDGKRPLRPWTLKTASERLMKNLVAPKGLCS